ncbi:MAG: Secretion system C-terminal sorting domain [Bacteroidota bacterium]
MHMIDVSAFRGNVQVSIFDDMGRLLQSQSEYVYPSQNKEITLNLHNLSSGVYYYTIKDDSKMVSNRILRVK